MSLFIYLVSISINIACVTNHELCYIIKLESTQFSDLDTFILVKTTHMHITLDVNLNDTVIETWKRLLLE